MAVRGRAIGGHHSVGSQPVNSGSKDVREEVLDPQDRMGAGTLYDRGVATPYTLFPFTHFPWMIIPAPQLGQAASLHNIYNSTPPVRMRFVPLTVTDMEKSNRIRSVMSHVTKLPASVTSALRGRG